MTAFTAGQFTVNLGTGQVSGLTEYVNSDRFSAKLRQIESGQDAVIRHVPAGIPVGQLVAVSLQTDYAAYLGAKELEDVQEQAMVKRIKGNQY